MPHSIRRCAVERIYRNPGLTWDRCKVLHKHVGLVYLRAVRVKNGASRSGVDFVQICDSSYDLGLCEKLGKITIKIFSSHLGDHQLLRAYIGSI